MVKKNVEEDSWKKKKKKKMRDDKMEKRFLSYRRLSRNMPGEEEFYCGEDRTVKIGRMEMMSEE